MKRLLLLLLSLPMLAQSPTPPKPPDIPPALLTKYFKAHSESADAQLQVVNAQKAVDAKIQAERQVIAEIQSVCGEHWMAQLSPSGDIVCVARPEPQKETKK